MTLTVKPAFGANISSKDWEKFFGKWFPNGVFDGLQVTAGSGLNINISAGTAHINGYFIESDSTETRSVNASTTNYVWCKLIRNASNFVTGWDFQVTTSSTPPSDSFLLATVVTSSSAVTSVTDQRNSGMAGIILEKTPSTSNLRPHLRIRDITTSVPYLEFVKTDGTSNKISFNLLSITTFTSSGTYNPPSGTKLLIVKMYGGGGGGGAGSNVISTANYWIGGGGGGGGAYREILILHDIGSSYTVTIGSGGSGGNAVSGSGGTSGGNGGQTIFGAVTANGGNGGAGGTSNTTSGGGGAGGSVTSSNAFFNIILQGVQGGNSPNNGINTLNPITNTVIYNGGIGGGVSNPYYGGGGGGAGYGGNGGNGGATGTNVSLNHGQSASANSGAGGGGGGTGGSGNAGNGGNGGSGKVIVYAYG
jgi:hypothetical protein